MRNLGPVKTKILQYSITIGVCLILSFVLATLGGIFKPWEVLHEETNFDFNSDLTKCMFLLTNSTFAVGVIALGIGLLILAANGGAFEMFVFGMGRFFFMIGSLFTKKKRKPKFETFYDYHVYHSEKPKTPFLFLIVVGIAFIALSILFLLIYQNNL